MRDATIHFWAALAIVIAGSALSYGQVERLSGAGKGSIEMFDGRVIPAMPELLGMGEQYELRLHWLEQLAAWKGHRNSQLRRGAERWARIMGRMSGWPDGRASQLPAPFSMRLSRPRPVPRTTRPFRLRASLSRRQ